MTLTELNAFATLLDLAPITAEELAALDLRIGEDDARVSAEEAARVTRIRELRAVEAQELRDTLRAAAFCAHHGI